MVIFSNAAFTALAAERAASVTVVARRCIAVCALVFALFHPLSKAVFTSLPSVVAAWVTAWLFPVIPVPMAVAPWVPAVVMVVVSPEVSTASALVFMVVAESPVLSPVVKAVAPWVPAAVMLVLIAPASKSPLVSTGVASPALRLVFNAVAPVIPMLVMLVLKAAVSSPPDAMLSVKPVEKAAPAWVPAAVAPLVSMLLKAFVAMLFAAAVTVPALLFIPDA